MGKKLQIEKSLSLNYPSISVLKTAKKKPNNHESKLQQACVRWFRLEYPKLVLYSIPNGGTRHQKEVAKIKAEGVLSGVPDLFLMKANRGFHGLYIEMKYGSNKPTDNQIDFMQKAKAEKYAVSVCYSFDEFVSVVKGYLKDC